MATARTAPPPSAPLTYKTRALSTRESASTRFKPQHVVPEGKVKSSGNVTVVRDEQDAQSFDISFTVTLTGHPKSGEDIAFSATCTVGYEVKFNETAPKELSRDTVKELALPLFYIALDRCRNLVYQMGYPSSANANIMPDFSQPDDQSEDDSSAPVAKRRAAPKRRRSTL